VFQDVYIHSTDCRISEKWYQVLVPELSSDIWT
jgi:hypothetical protein